MGEEQKLREALAEIAGIAAQRGTDKSMFTIADFKRLGDIERLARSTLSGEMLERRGGE
jgi:hypothetical protein